MPLISNRPYTILERGKITNFLRMPHLKNLPPQIKTNALKGVVFLCHAPDGQRILLQTAYKREVIISIRYQGGNVYAELRASKSISMTFELFLVKEGNRIHHSAKKVDPDSLRRTAKKYRKPKIILASASDKLKRGHQIESWLKDQAGIPSPYTAKAHKDKKQIRLCSYNGEAVMLNLGSKFKHRSARVTFIEAGAFKQVAVTAGRMRWEFDLACERGKCIVRSISEPL